MKMLRKRIIASVLALTMVISSMQFSQYTVYAEEMAGEVSETVIADSGAEERNTLEDAGESIEEVSEKQDLEDNSEESNQDGQNEVENSEQADSDDSDDETENFKETDAEYETVEIEKNEEVVPVGPEEKLVCENANLDSIYQLGGAPSDEDMEANFSIESDGEAAEVREVNGITIEDYIYQEILKRNPEIDVSEYNIEYELKKVSRLVNGVINEHPDLYFATPYQYGYNPYSGIWTQAYVNYDNTLNDAAFQRETRVALSVVKEGMTDLQKAIVLHDYLTVNCEYDNENYNAGTVPDVSHSAYGPLVNRIAVCDGYALAYKYLLNQVGIDCYMVTSDTMHHAWNLIELNGKYYQVDVTWDDPTWDIIGRSCHSYMFCSDEVFKDSKHNHMDWEVTFGSNIVDYKATDTTYDNAFWIDVNSPLVLTVDDLNVCYFTYFYSDAYSAKATINKTNLSLISDKGSAIYYFDVWPVWDGGGYIYTTPYSGLFQNNNRLYFNDKTSICSIDFNGTGKKTEFTADTSNAYIYGSALCQGKVLYTLHQVPNMGKKETVLEANINIQEEGPANVPVESVTLDHNTLTLVEDASAKLNATVTPSYATNPAVTWSSSDSSVATVNNGTVTAVGVGECTITATADGKKAECKVTVNKKVILVASISLNKSTLELKTGDTEVLTATVLPANATNKTVTWISNNESVAMVSNGTVKAVGEGTCTITASAGGKTASCAVTVTKKVIPVESISLSKSELELKTDDTAALSATVLPNDATDKTVTWSSNNNNVATVSNGTVTAVGVGECTITATAGSKKAECKVTVKPKVIPVENIILDRGSLELEEGEVITIQATVIPGNATDKTVTWSSSNDAIATVKDGEVTAIKKGECTITATAGAKSAVCNIVVSEFAPRDSIASGIYQKIRWFIDKEGKLTVKGSGDFASASTSRTAPWYEYRNSIISADINVTGMTDASYMFSECENLASIDMRRFDTSQVTSMCGMFIGCYGLTNINWDNLDTGKVTNMSWMFSQCTNLSNLDLSCFDTDKVKNMSNMFDSCSNLSSIDISSFRTDSVTNMSFMFSGCLKLTDLDLTNFVTTNVTDIRGMFSSCYNLTNLNLSSFDMTKVTRDDDNMLGGCTKLTTIHTPCNLGISVSLPLRTNEVWRQPDETEITELPTNLSESIIISRSKKEIIYDNDIASGSYGDVTWVIDKDGKLTVSGTGDFAAPMNGDASLRKGRAPWYQYRDLIISAEVNITGMTDASYMFYDCDNLTTLSLSGFNTSQIADMSSMFSGCSSLESLDLSGFDTSHVTDINGMFNGCSSLNSLNLSGFDTQLVTDMGAMFKDCSSLTVLNVSHFNTSQVKDIASMFNNCSSLTSLDLGNFNLNNVDENKVSGVLAGCTSLVTINAPLNLSHLVALPVESGYIWCQPNEEETTILPVNLSNSIEIQKKEIVLTNPFITATKTKTSYECDDVINIDDLIVEYHDERGRTTPVTDYSTNVNEIYTSEEGTKKLIITYRGLIYEIELTITKKPDDNNDQELENTEGLKVELVEPNKAYIYTGYAITPKIKVTNNGKPVYEGVDYTVKYTNNIKANTGTDGQLSKKAKPAQIIVTGKGNFAGSKSQPFNIVPKNLDNSDFDENDENAMKVEGTEVADITNITVIEGNKISPSLFYGGVKLTAKDFKFVDDKYKTYKWKNEDNNTEISIEGLGNFKGNRKLNVIVIPKSEQKDYKISVTITDSKAIKNLPYNGSPQNIDGFIKVSTKKAPDASEDSVNGLKKDRDYKIYYPKDITSAGTKKVTIVGISDRCIGTVTKSYTIKPKKMELSVEFDKSNEGYTFVSTGTTVDNLVVKAKGENTPLEKGKDYKVTYSKNKKVGTGKITVTGIGNYKGSKASKDFKINPAVLCSNAQSSSEVTADLKIAVCDKVFKKPGMYKSAPYVSINGVLLKASNYIVTYYLDDPVSNPTARVMDNKNNKVTNENSDTTVWVMIKGKGNYATTDSTCYAVASYKVRTKAESDSYDLSKAKIIFKDKEGNNIKKVNYTGKPITENDVTVVVTYKIGRETVTLNGNDHYDVTFVNNVNKGKATVVITGKPGQTKYVGSKTAGFNIVTSSVKDIINWFK